MCFLLYDSVLINSQKSKLVQLIPGIFLNAAAILVTLLVTYRFCSKTAKKAGDETYTVRKRLRAFCSRVK